MIFFKLNSLSLFRVYTVAVYFRQGRLAKAQGHSIQQAEMNAAKLALETCSHLFPHLNYQKRIMERSFKRQGVVTETIRETWYKETLKKRKELGLDVSDTEDTGVKKEIKEESLETEQDTGGTDIQVPGCDLIDNPCPSTSAAFQAEAATQEQFVSPSETREYQTAIPSLNVLDETSKGEKSKIKEVIKEAPTKKNIDRAKAEIKEIESQLKRKEKERKKRKVVEAKIASGDLEDGECVDSEEDFDTEPPQVKSVSSQPGAPQHVVPPEPEAAPPAPPQQPPQQPPAPPPEDRARTREERREDNRRRWSSERRHGDRERWGRHKERSRDRRHDNYY